MKKLIFFLSLFFCSFQLKAQFNDSYPCKHGLMQLSSLNQTLSIQSTNIYDVKYYKINLNVSNLNTQVSGNVNMLAMVSSAVLDTFYFDLSASLNIDSVLIDGISRPYYRAGQQVAVHLGLPLVQGDTLKTQVFYGGNGGAGGGFFSGISNSFSSQWQTACTWTLSEPFGAPDWLAIKQDLTDKIDSVEFIGTTSLGNRVGSNGLLLQIDTLVSQNLVRYHWKTTYPMAFYLIAFAVAPYTDLSFYAPLPDGDSVLIQNYIYDAVMGNGTTATQFYLTGMQATGAMMQQFSQQFGKYPFFREKYGHMLAPLNGGMEHQTMSTMGNFGTDLTAHELIHHWFGNLVTCASWQDIWINEGFASYGEYLYREGSGTLNALQWMQQAHNTALQTNNSVYVPAGASVNRIFNFATSYRKAGAAIHTLRYILGDSLFFHATNHFLQQFAFSNASTQDLLASLNQSTGKNLQNFFDEWIYGFGYPIYTIEYNIINNQLLLLLGHTSTDARTPVFSNALPIKINFSNGQDTIISLQNGILTRILLPIGATANFQIDPMLQVIKAGSTLTQNNLLGLGNSFPENAIISIYPNPSQDYIQIKGLQKNMIANVYGIDGKLIFSKTVEPREVLDISSLSAGVYVLKIGSSNLKFVKV